MKTLKEELASGTQFSNGQGDWYTVNRPQEGLRMIVIRGENKFYKNLDSYAKRIQQLINRGY